MAVYAKKMNGKQKAWCKKYENETTFECIHQEDLDSGEMTFEEFARENIKWFENWSSDALLNIGHYPQKL